MSGIKPTPRPNIPPPPPPPVPGGPTPPDQRSPGFLFARASRIVVLREIRAWVMVVLAVIGVGVFVRAMNISAESHTELVRIAHEQQRAHRASMAEYKSAEKGEVARGEQMSGIVQDGRSNNETLQEQIKRIRDVLNVFEQKLDDL